MALGERLGGAAKILFEGTAVECAVKRLDTDGKVRIQAYPEKRRSFDLDQGAVYLGALPRRSPIKKAVDALDFRDTAGAYSETGVLAVLEQAALQRKEGRKLKIILFSSLREKCNDGEAPVLTFNEQVARITRLCGQHLKLKPQDLEFINMAEEYQDLFQPLQGAEDLEAAFARVPESEEWGSYRIAYDLYQAVKTNEAFAQVCKALMPEGLPEETDDSGFSFLAAYSLFETAIHLADIIKGRSTQIGVGRQSKYNEVVIALMRGKKGPWRDLNELEALFEKVEGLNFTGVNVSKSPSPVTSAIRRARARMCVGTQMAGAASLLALGVEGGQMIEQHMKADLDAVYAERMGEIVATQTCGGEDSWMGSLDQRDKVYRLKNRLDGVREVLRVRYGIEYDDSEWERVGIPSFLDYLAQETQGEGYNGVCDFLLFYAQYSQDMADRFVQAHWSSFRSKGYNVTRPYAYLGDLKFDHFSTPQKWCTANLDLGISVNEIGEFLPFNQVVESTELYEVADHGTTYLATQEKDGCFSTEAIPKIEEEYDLTLRRWASLPFHFHNNDFYAQPSNDGNEAAIGYTDSSISKRFPPFVDPMGQFAYEPVLVTNYTANSWPDQYVLARRQGETKYTKEAAFEMYHLMDHLLMPWIVPDPLAPKSDQTKP